MSKLISVLLVLMAFKSVYSQDSLTIQDLKPYTYYFSIENNEIVGDGLAFLQNEAKKNQYFLLAEYHNSKRYSLLTKALIPILDKEGYEHIALEIGPNTADILDKLSNKEDKLIEEICFLNTKHSLQLSNGYTHTAIPFFKNVSDAEFLAVAKKHNWQLFGLDQEFYYGFTLLIESAFNEQSPYLQKKLKPDYLLLIDTLNHYYAIDTIKNIDRKKKSFIAQVRSSSFCQGFFDKFLKTNVQNQKLIRDLRQSVEIYWYSIIHEYWITNNMRVENFISNLKESFSSTNFDLSSDKMFIKMGGFHTQKGNHYQIYDLGNTLFELARYYENTSIHIGSFYPRFYYKNDSIIDELKTESELSRDDKTILQMAVNKDSWTIIDLRPLKRTLFYPRLQQFRHETNKMFQDVDVILIPPIALKPNFNINKIN